MENIKSYVLIALGAYIFSHVPQPFASAFVAMLMIAGVKINRRDDSAHAKEKEKLKKEIQKAKSSQEQPWHVVLGLDPNATIAEATKVRRLLSKIYHEDNGEIPNKKAMQRINQAYEEKQALEKDNQSLLS